MIGYYDIHTHILPGVDDGARDMLETQEMLCQAYGEGIRYLVATPHFVPDGKNPSVKELQEKLEAVRRIAARLVPEMKLALGNELLDGAGVVDALKEGRALTLGGTRYILVEFLPQEGYQSMYHSLRNYIMHGYIPILAHVERYEALYRKPGNLCELIKLGVFFQMNTGSLLGGMFRRSAVYHRKLLEDGYIHFLGSDCHRKDSRMPLMEGVLQNLRRTFPDSDTGRAVLLENPARMLADKYI